MKIAAKILLVLLMASIILPGFASAAEPGAIPEIGNITGPSTTTDVTGGLGIFSKLGQFLMDYSIHIAVFVMVLAIVILSARGSWARSNQRSEEASESRSNTKGLIIDGVMTMAALMFVFFILAPFVKSFIPT
jgi:hypothetical protein